MNKWVTSLNLTRLKPDDVCLDDIFKYTCKNTRIFKRKETLFTGPYVNDPVKHYI